MSDDRLDEGRGDGPDDGLLARFEESRPWLRAVAYRMLGSISEADDAVQETWLRLSRYGGDRVDNLGGWLRTVVSRVCLDALHTRGARREEPLGVWVPDPVVSVPGHAGFAQDPEQEALLADSVGLALQVVLQTLTPAERLAFVLHDMFAVPFEEIAAIVERSPAATRSSRAARAAGSRSPRRSRTPTWAASVRWSRRSWRPRARVTSRRWWRCWIPMSCCARTTGRCPERSRAWYAARRTWRSRR